MSEEVVKYFTLAEIKVRNGKDDSRVWCVYRDVVYDLTEYLEDHPGGGDLITEYAGKDMTKAFDDFGHSSDAKKDLKKYKIGEVVEEERKGKKKVAAPKAPLPSRKPQQRSCISIVTCGLCG